MDSNVVGGKHSDYGSAGWFVETDLDFGLVAALNKVVGQDKQLVEAYYEVEPTPGPIDDAARGSSCCSSCFNLGRRNCCFNLSWCSWTVLVQGINRSPAQATFRTFAVMSPVDVTTNIASSTEYGSDRRKNCGYRHCRKFHGDSDDRRSFLLSAPMAASCLGLKSRLCLNVSVI